MTSTIKYARFLAVFTCMQPLAHAMELQDRSVTRSSVIPELVLGVLGATGLAWYAFKTKAFEKKTIQPSTLKTDKEIFWELTGKAQSTLADNAKLSAILKRSTELPPLTYQRDKKGSLALINAAAANNPEVVQLLLQHGAKVNGHDAQGNTALMKATAHGNPAIIHKLLSYDSYISVPNNAGQTAITIATEQGNYALADWLQEKKIEKEQAFIKAARRGDITQLETLLPDVDVNVVHNGSTALYEAAQFNREPVLHFLINHGAHVGGRHGTLKKSPQFYSATFSDLPEELQRILKEAPAKLKARLFSAASTGDIEQLTDLLGAVDINSQDKAGNNALFKAINKNQRQAAQFLVDHGIQLRRNKQNDTLLIPAIFSGNPDMLHFALDLYQNPPIDAQNADGNTALMTAAAIQDPAMVKILLQRGADTTLKNNGGYTVANMPRPFRPEGRAIIEELARYIIDTNKSLAMKPSSSAFTLADK